MVLSALRLPALSAAALVLWLSACGDGPDAPLPPTSAVSSSGSPTASADELGPAPALGSNVLEITPPHASKPTQRSTRTANQNQPRGVCAKVSFEGLPEKLRWFRLSVDDKEVTPQLTWVVSGEQATDGRVCYAPKDGLPVGRHTAVLSLIDPARAGASPRHTVAWAFDVVPDP